MSFIACADMEENQINESSIGEAVQQLLPGDIEAFECEAPTGPKSESSEGLRNVPLMTASVTVPLPYGTYIDIRDQNGHPKDVDSYLNHGLYVQRLNDRSYVMFYNDFGSYVYAGDHGLLMMDCGGSNAGQIPIVMGPNGPEFQQGGQELANIENGLRMIAQSRGRDYDTNLPLKALVLSHPHTDHVGHSMGLKFRYPGLRIITSKQLADNVRQYRLAIALGDDACYDFTTASPKTNCTYHPYLPRLPRNREIITSRMNGKFKFEGKTFRLLTPTQHGHSAADSLLFSPDGVHMSVDTLGTEGRLSFVRNSVAGFPAGVVMNNRVLLGEAGFECDVTDPVTGLDCELAGPTQQPSWYVATSGHFNVSYVKDVIETLRYYRAMNDAWHPAMFGALQNGVPKTPQQFAPQGVDTVAMDRVLEGIFHSQAEDMAKLLAPTYHTHLHWASAYGDMDNWDEMHFLYFNGLGNALAPPDFNNPQAPPGGTVDFSPIPPGAVPEWGDVM